MDKYDLCVIGAGPSGYAAAMRAVDFKYKVLLLEKYQLGGAGIHHGGNYPGMHGICAETARLWKETVT